MEKYLKELEIYSRSLFDEHLPKGKHQKGTVKNMISWLESYQNEIGVVTNLVIDKANELIEKAENDPEIQSDNIKETFLSKSQDLIREFLKKANQ